MSRPPPNLLRPTTLRRQDMFMVRRGLNRTAFGFALLSPTLLAGTSLAWANDHRPPHLNGIEHVLLLSIDGLHAVDLANCVAAGTCPNLERLTEHGVTYTNASTTKPSDSFPGLLAQVTGGTSKSTGVFYDDSFDRTLFAPAGSPPAPCSSGPGAETQYAENVDKNLHSIDGGAPSSLSLIGPNSAVAIDPNNLPGQLVHGVCKAVWPHNFIRTNTIFGVIHRHHLRTAWSDKHPAYEIVNGNDPDTQPTNRPGTNVDDFFAPEINSDLSAANVQLIASLGLHSTAPNPVTDPTCPGPNCGSDFTSSIDGIEFYDGIKVQAILNEINGFDHTGTKRMETPAIFGMNFQAVSVGQKLTADGYLDSRGTPSPGLANAIAFVDRSVGQMMEELADRRLLQSTLVIVSAKHGQSPIDVNKLHKIAEASLQAAVNAVGAGLAFDVADDVALLPLTTPPPTTA